jgi:hypothetical protein
LWEGEQTRISWGDVDSKEGYILQRSFNKTFEQAAAGRDWSGIDAENKSWTMIEQEGLTWGDFELLTTLGKTWESIDYGNADWDDIEAAGLSWNEWGRQPPSFEIYRGAGIATTGYTWKEWEDEGPVDWDKAEAKNRTWDLWASAELHHSAADAMPAGAKSVAYRVAAYDSGGDASGFLTAGMFPVVPIFYRESAAQWNAEAGGDYWLIIEGRQIRDLGKVLMTLQYPADVLALESFLAHAMDKQTSSGLYPSAYLRIVEGKLGKVKFFCTRPLPTGKKWSGLITVAHFVAQKSAAAEAGLY